MGVPGDRFPFGRSFRPGPREKGVERKMPVPAGSLKGAEFSRRDPFLPCSAVRQIGTIFTREFPFEFDLIG